MTPSKPGARLIKLNPRDYGHSRYALRLWHGMRFGAFRRLMKGNLGKVSPERYGLLASVTVLSLGNSILFWLGQAIYGRRVAATQVSPDPVFIIGHWRSGTTWLNQLLARDPRFASPTGSQVFMPDTFLVARLGIQPIVHLLIRGKRPMDNVQVSMKSVEEDEIALCNMGAPSHFQHNAFPDSDLPSGFLYFSDMTEEGVAYWLRCWDRFLKSVQFVNPGKQLLLKSPGHTIRIDMILKRYPNARFIHIARDPYRIMLSHMRASPALSAAHGFYTGPVDLDRMRDKGFDRFRKFHDTYHRLKPLIPEGQLAEIRYEDLRRDPVGVLGRAYDTLGLADFGAMRPHLQAFVKDISDYKTNRFDISDEEERAIWDNCRFYFEHYGYQRMDARETPRT